MYERYRELIEAKLIKVVLVLPLDYVEVWKDVFQLNMR